MLPTHSSAVNFAPVGTHVFVQMDDIYQQSLKLPSGVEIFLAQDGDIEDDATVVAKVYCEAPNGKHGLKHGEEVALSYMVLADYTYGRDGETKFFNRVHQVGDDIVWQADASHIIAVKRDGKWKACGDWVIVEDIFKPLEVTKSGIFLNACMDKGEDVKAYGGRLKDRGTLISGDLDIPEGTVVFFKDDYRGVYRFPDGKEYGVMDKQYILAHA